jgi:hypothetical protein
MDKDVVVEVGRCDRAPALLCPPELHSPPKDPLLRHGWTIREGVLMGRQCAPSTRRSGMLSRGGLRFLRWQPDGVLDLNERLRVSLARGADGRLDGGRLRPEVARPGTAEARRRQSLAVATRTGHSERVDDIGGQVAVEHLASLVRRWADAAGVVAVISASPTNLDGVRCTLHLSGCGEVRFDFLFTTGVESSDADDAIVEGLAEAWAEGWLDDSEFWVSGMLDESAVVGRRKDDPPTSSADVVSDAN